MLKFCFNDVLQNVWVMLGDSEKGEGRRGKAVTEAVIPESTVS